MGLRSNLVVADVFNSARVKGSLGRAHLPRALLGLCLFEVAYAVAYRYAMEFSQLAAAPFWFPDSVLLCALLLTRPRYWPLLVIAPLPVRLLSPESAALPAWFLLTTFAIDSAKGVLGASLLRRCLDNPLRFASAREFARYAVLMVALVPAVAASAGATARYFLGHEFWPAWTQWFAGNALTHLVITPVILYWVIGAPWRRPWPSGSRAVEAALLALGLVAATVFAFASGFGGSDFDHSRYYLPLPFLVWAATRFGMLGATGGIAVVGFAAVQAALTGHAAFIGKTPDQVAFILQEFLAVRAAPLYVLAVLFSEMRRATRSLRESEQRYREVVNTQSDLVCRFLPDTTLTFVNAAYCKYFGRTADELVGRRFLELLPPDARDAALRHIELATGQSEPNVYEHEVELPGGGRGWQQWTDYPIFDTHGRLTEYQSIGHDITDRKRAEEASQNLIHASRLASVGALTAVIAHEITQPLSAMLANAQAAVRLLQTNDPPLAELREILADICDNNRRANHAISRIQALARNRRIRLQPLDINDATKDVLRLTAGDALRRKVAVVSELAPDLPLVSGDRVHLQQVLLNLVVNAMDAMSDGASQQRQLTVQTRRMTNGTGCDVEVTVRDSGPGIAEHRLPQIFESFFTTKPEGMGMGLAIARSIILAHGGRIWVESGAGTGATFGFVLPAGTGESWDEPVSGSPAIFTLAPLPMMQHSPNDQ